nr:CpsB/CapC family capsule biosynthesis tyrosine phosphatase [uncultured Mediterraneibacter sp.]
MIDIHSHILPELDDGSSGMTESMEMLQMAYRQGIRQVVATPHYSRRFSNTSPEQIRKLCMDVQETACRDYNMDLKIYPGQEIMYTNDVIDLLRSEKILTLADSRYVLTEFFPTAGYSDIYRAVRELTRNGYYPVLAHAERYPCLREGERIDEIRDQGGYIQLNYRSTGGKWYDGTTRWCRKVLKEEKVDFMGTDMHNVGNRCPSTEPALKWMNKHLSKLYIWKILNENPEKVTVDEKI